MFNDNNFSIEREVKEKFYKTSNTVKILKAKWKAESDEKWEKVGASIKRGFMQTSILLGMGFVSFHLIYA